MGLQEIMVRAARAVASRPSTELATDTASSLWQGVPIPSHSEWLAWTGFSPVSVASALTVPGIFRAVQLIVDLASQIEWHEEVRRINADGTVRWERLPQPSMIVRQPNPLEPTEATIAAAVGGLAKRGEAFVRLERAPGERRTVIRAEVAHPNEIKIEWADDRVHRIYHDRGRRVDLYRDLLHIKNLELEDALHALGPIQAYARQITGSSTVEDWAYSYFSKGGQTPTAIKVPGPADEDEANELKAAWIDSHGGTLEPAVLFGGAEVENLGMDPDKAQAIETRRWNVQLAASMFGLNPYMLAVAMSGANITYQTLPDLFAEAVRLVIYPSYLRKIERDISYLLPRGHRVRFDLSEFLRADEKTRMETAQIAIGAGVASADEWRAREGLAPRNGAEVAQ